MNLPTTIPSELHSHPNWVLWQPTEMKDKDGTVTLKKIPYQGINPSAMAKSNDSKTWTTFDTVCMVPTPKNGGIGYCFDGSGVYGIDLDGAINPDGEIYEPFKEIVNTIRSYQEISPSKRGLHLILRCATEPYKSGKSKQWFSDDGVKHEVALFGTGRYFTVTGDRFNDISTVEDIPVDVIRLVLDPFLNPPKKQSKAKEEREEDHQLTDDEIISHFHHAKNSVKFNNLFNRGSSDGFPSQSEADAALIGMIRFYTDDANQIIRLMKRSGLNRDKYSREDYLTRTVAKVLSLPSGEKYKPGKTVTKKPEIQTQTEVKELDLAVWIRDHKEVNAETLTGEDIKKLMAEGFRVNSADIGSGDSALIGLLCFIGGREVTGDGLHLKVSGMRGCGKSVTINAVLCCLPQDTIYAGAFTPRALVYDNNIRPGIIVKVDESQELTPEFLSVMKESISSFQTPIKYRTVLDKKEGTITRLIPERISWVIVACDNVGEEQVLDRLYPVGVESKDKYGAITAFRLTRREHGQEKMAVTDAVLKIRYALSHYIGKKFKVIIPFASKIKYDPTVKSDQRLQEFFENCITYHAALCYRERTHTMPDSHGVITVTATEEDFNGIKMIENFNKPIQTTHRLLPSEIELIKKIVTKGYNTGRAVKRSDILALGYSQSGLSNILNGRNKGDNGLLSKVSGMNEVKTSKLEVNKLDEYDKHTESEIAYIIPASIANMIPTNADDSSQAVASLMLEKSEFTVHSDFGGNTHEHT